MTPCQKNRLAQVVGAYRRHLPRPYRWWHDLVVIAIVLWSIPIGLTSANEPEILAKVLDTAPADLVVNAEGQTYDSKASLAVSPDGGVWMAWHAYHLGRDRVLARRVGPNELGPVQTVSEAGTVHDAPVVVAAGKDGAWVFWAAKLDGRWQILGRAVANGKWLPIERLSPPDDDCIFPSAAVIDDDRLILAWCAHRAGGFRILGRILENGTPKEPFVISLNEQDAFRSTLAVDADERVWIFWDAYQRGKYAVWGKPVLPELGPAEQVSPQGQNCLTPVALAAKQGLSVAWLQAVDVIGGQGAVSQRYTLHLAVRTRKGWQFVRTADDSTAAAELTYGLIARIEPKPVATGGYMGRRRHPMLIEDGQAVWLLWERKADHRGTSPTVAGELIGRRSANGRWEQPVILHQGLLDYRLADDSRAYRGKFFFAASNLPGQWRRIYHRMVGDLTVSVPLEQEKWIGWRPVDLPLAQQTGPRYELDDHGKVYRLYWGDLHCHSGLTADAEGEPDELLYYARDRARLDVVVMTENDALYDCYLTEAEFALGHFLANRFSREGKFLVLPGFEWTSRLPRSPDVDRADPKNWDSRYGRDSYPNHRSIIYPPSGGPVVRHPEVENDIGRLNQAVAKAGGVTLTQHKTWDLTGHPVEVGVEVTAGWGIYIRKPQQVHEALNKGYRFGMVANGDSHRRTPGMAGALTAIYAESLTPEAILDALRNRRVYATNGSRIVIHSRANGSLMGQEVQTGGGVEITLSVVGTKPIVTATLIRDGEEIKTFQGNGSPRLSLTYEDKQLSQGTHWYYWRIAQEGQSPNYPGNVKVAHGHLAWSTPHWVTVKRGTSIPQPSAGADGY